MKKSAFIKELNTHYDSFIGFACKLCGNKNDALDIVQEASIRAFRNKEGIEEVERFKSWFFTIIKNTYINLFNKRTRRRKLFETAPKSTFKYLLSQGRNKGISKLNFEAINNQIVDIGEMYRKPFFLHYHGYSYEEISQRLEVPMGTVKSRIFTAKKKMQRKLKPLLAA